MFTLAFAQDGGSAGQAAQSQPNFMFLTQIALIFIIFYFLLIRPQKKQQREHADMISNLKKNDEAVTSGGIHGTIVNIQDDIVTLRVDENTRIKIQKGSISRLKKK